MKRLILLFSMILGVINAIAQTELTITIDTNVMFNTDCNLNGNGAGGPAQVNKVYMHAGACSENRGSNAQQSAEDYCLDQILPFASDAWQHVVGNWGLNPQDDGVGEMTDLGNGVYQIQIDVESYFSNPSLVNDDIHATGVSQSTLLNPEDPVHVIAMVFRNEDGTASGRDQQGCNDIFIVDFDTDNPVIINSTDYSWSQFVTVQNYWCSPANSVATVEACDSYNWNSTTYDQSGTYTFETTTAQGCDSTATLNLTINQSTQDTMAFTLCDGEPIVINGITYAQSGQYSQTLSGPNNCDTTLIIDIVSEFGPDVNILGNHEISPNSGEDYAITDPGGYTITWSATNGTIIHGQGSPLVTIFWDSTGEGQVSVTLSNSDCSFNYALEVGNTTDIEPRSSPSPIVHPNPSPGIFRMELNEPTQIKVMDTRGRAVLESYGSGRIMLDLSAVSSGTYTLYLRTESAVGVSRLLKY